MDYKTDELLSILYTTLKNSELGNIATVKAECELLDISVPDEILLGLQEITLKTESLSGASELLPTLSEEKMGAIREGVDREERAKLEKEERKRGKREEDAAAKKQADSNAKALRSQMIELAKQVNFHEHISEFKILSSKHHYDLEKQVKNGLKSGWKPYGNLAVYHPGGNPLGSAPDYFFQAVVKFSYKN